MLRSTWGHASGAPTPRKGAQARVTQARDGESAHQQGTQLQRRRERRRRRMSDGGKVWEESVGGKVWGEDVHVVNGLDGRQNFGIEGGCSGLSN
eukprot:1159523-Pelagomonas_calceolata.AAC.2